MNSRDPRYFIIMKFMCLALLAVPAWSGYSPISKQSCRLEWQDVVSPQCTTTNEQVCADELQDECTTEYSTSCKMWSLPNVLRPMNRFVPMSSRTSAQRSTAPRARCGLSPMYYDQ